ncbi:14262_t:CDS:1, partial [Funneliformis mosseae]
VAEDCFDRISSAILYGARLSIMEGFHALLTGFCLGVDSTFISIELMTRVLRFISLFDSEVLVISLCRILTFFLSVVYGRDLSPTYTSDVSSFSSSSVKTSIKLTFLDFVLEDLSDKHSLE